MRSVCITRTGPPEALEVRDGPDPVPGPGQALVRVRATGVNFADVMARLGLYPDAPPRPCVDRKSTRLNSSHLVISYAVFCLKKKKKNNDNPHAIIHVLVHRRC